MKFFKDINEKFGPVEEYSIYNWNVHTLNLVVGEGSGSTYTLVYSVNRTKISSMETFTIFNPKGTNNYSLLSFHVNTDEFV